MVFGIKSNVGLKIFQISRTIWAKPRAKDSQEGVESKDAPRT